MIYSKNPLDYDEQIKMLKARGLIIADEQKAINSQRVISYFGTVHKFCVNVEYGIQV
jgi:abortive infection bacteriophage resistance protein